MFLFGAEIIGQRNPKKLIVLLYVLLIGELWRRRRRPSRFKNLSVRADIQNVNRSTY